MGTIDLKKLKIRSLKEGDVGSVVKIDAEVLGQERTEFYQRKCKAATDSSDQLVTSLVAEYEGQIIGFVMGNLYLGEYGIPEKTASLDTIGVSPDYQKKGIGSELIKTYIEKLRKAGVEKIYGMIEWNDWSMFMLFEKCGFVPSRTINLELKV